MVKIWVLLILPGLLGGSFGCASSSGGKDKVKEKPAAPLALTAAHFAEGRLQAEAFQRAFWQVYQGGDAALLTPFLPDQKSPQELADALKKQRQFLEKRYGRMVSSRFGGELEKPAVHDYFWIIRFEKKAALPVAGTVATELLFMVRAARLKDGVKVVGYGLRP